MQQLTHTSSTSKDDSLDIPPLYVRLGDKIEARILSGEWKPGDIVPNETDFAKEYNVSAGTMRKALDGLEAKGFLTRRQGRGTFVTDKKANDAKRRHACTKKSLDLIREAEEDTGQKVPAKLHASLQKRMAQALVDAVEKRQ